MVRTPEEIANNWRLRLSGTEANLVACYRFDEAGGIFTYDASPNQCHGKLSNWPLRVYSYWWPVVVLGGAHRLTNECHEPFVDYGATATAYPIAIAAGDYHSLVLRPDGTVVGWGDNRYGQTDGTRAGSNVVAIAAGGKHSLALRADGSIVAWGWNSSGQTNVPVAVNLLNLPVAVSGTVDVNVPGTYELTYRVTNALGAVGTATRTVVVVDTRPPILTLLGGQSLDTSTGHTVCGPRRHRCRPARR